MNNSFFAWRDHFRPLERQAYQNRQGKSRAASSPESSFLGREPFRDRAAGGLEPSSGLKAVRVLTKLPLLLGLMVNGLFPALLWGQGLARQALASFPADTEQLAYANLADLRRLPNYAEIRQRLFARQLRDFEDFLRSMGADPERDVEEVVLGWRGQKLQSAAFFGVAGGRFEPDKARTFFAGHGLPVREYEGQNLYAFGSGEDPADLFFTFIDSSSAALGHLTDLKALLDVRAGTRPALDSNSAFVNWEAELEGAAPQWGIASRKALAAQGTPWLPIGEKGSGNLSAFLAPIEAVLYRIEWSRGLSTQLSILCQNRESAEVLAKLLALWKDSEASPSAPKAAAASLSDLDVRAQGSRVELSATGSLGLIESLRH